MKKLHHIECGCIECTRMRNNTIEHLADLLKHQMEMTDGKQLPSDGGIRIDAVVEAVHADTGESRTVIIMELVPEGFAQPMKFGIDLAAFGDLVVQVHDAVSLMDALKDSPKPKTKPDPRSN